MIWTTLDKIVKSCLLQQEKTQHWYLQYLKLGTDCLRELHFDTLKVVNTIRLTPNSYNAVGIPCDYVDFVRIGIPRGQFVQPLLQRDGISRLNNFSDTGAKIPYAEIPNDNSEEDSVTVGGLMANWLWIDNHWNAQGENIGRYFGIGAGSEPDTFIVLKERSEIQLNEALSSTEILLEYISNGQTSNSATKIEPYAQKTIETYIFWKSSPNANNENSPEAQQHFNAEKRLRARMNELTDEDIIRIFRRGYKSTYKS